MHANLSAGPLTLMASDKLEAGRLERGNAMALMLNYDLPKK